ncbi:MAG: aminoacyl-tRNA hydrolase [Ndongobacter sp.]|nr:aminoacyl-tRNA hydrolase [Ndongobacter sp.]
MRYVIVGLGNPGSRYDGTRHNVGFKAIDELAQRWGIEVRTLKWKSLIGEGRVGSDQVLLVKPQTYMNESGRAIKDIVDFYKLEMTQLIVICDDIDIPLGTIRIRRKGSAGTHNGMRSVVYQLNNDSFPRIKISVGRRPAYMDLAAFVLSQFDAKEQKAVGEEIRCAADAAERVIQNGVEAAMNTYNAWRAPSVPHETAAERAKREAERAEQDAFRAVGCGMKENTDERESRK